MKIKKSDVIIFAVIVVIALIIQGAILLVNSRRNATKVNVKVDGESVAEYKLDSDDTYTFDEDGYKNKVIIKNGEVYMESANCRDQICVKKGKISEPGESIVCLPHKLVVEIE